MSTTNRIESVVGAAALVSLVAMSPPLLADGAGAFLGGMITSRVLQNMGERTQAEQIQAAAAVQQSSQPQVVYAPPPADSSGGSGTGSVEKRLNTLDSLLAQGYITKSEYNKRKQAILDGI